MSVANSGTITQGTPVQVLTGSYHIARISATGTAGASIRLYDSVGTKVQTNPSQTFKNLTNAMSPVRARTGIADCAGIKRDYDYPGAGYSSSDTSVGGASPMNLPPAAEIPNGTSAMDVDIVTTRGLYAEVIGSAGNTGVLVVEYFPNLAAPMP